MILTINGTPSSGKGTIAKKLAEKFNLIYYSIGDIKRIQAKERNMGIQEFNDWANKNPTQGHRVFDEAQKKIGETQDNIIFDGRVSFYFIPHSIKIHLTCDYQIAAQRRFEELQKNQTRNEGKFETVDDVKTALENRHRTDKKFFQTEYGINVDDVSNYDIVIDTTHRTPTEVLTLILKKL